MNINIATGLIEGIDFLPSPNCSPRPADTLIDLLVIHGISLPPGKFGGPAIKALFTNTLDPNAHPAFQAIADLQVSAHLFIARQGQVTQFVPFSQAAWHAGQSIYAGRERCNDFSIGIELEGTDTYPYEDLQYHQLAILSRAIIKAYPGITPARIVGHSDIAPGRKTDPGTAFKWDYFFSLLAESA